MEHLDSETLSLLALGERAALEQESAHLAQCPPCAAELAALERVVVAGRAGADSPALSTPDDAVWARICAELELDAQGASGDRLTAGDSEETQTDSAGEPPSRGGTSQAPPAGAERAPRRRWQRSAWIAAAAFLLGIGTAVVTERVLAPSDPEPPVLATAQLEPLPQWSEIDAGAAALHELDGRTVLRVELTEDASDGYREVWLIDTALERLVSLGVLVGDEGLFDIPEDLDLDEFLIVDVSAEPYDGDPAHSGDSIVRGELS